MGFVDYVQAIIDGLADPVCVFDADWRVVLVNQRLIQTLGLPPDIVGRHATELDDLVPGRFVQMEATELLTSLERRVRAARLSSGDVVRAGQIELEFRTYLGRVA